LSVATILTRADICFTKSILFIVKSAAKSIHARGARLAGAHDVHGASASFPHAFVATRATIEVDEVDELGGAATKALPSGTYIISRIPYYHR
jgi:hypothetical protein